MNRLASILLWSILAAAFIGPGTVTTAASAGAGHGFALLWALTFSTLACLVLQEASARLTVVSGRNLGEALRERYRGGVAGALMLFLVLGAIVFGCAAYEVGNILGGVVGGEMATGLSPRLLTLISGALAVLLLWRGRPATVAQLLSVLVAVMGAAFLISAIRLAPPVGEVLAGALTPTAPVGSGLLILGLVGTTVVPYNLFLGSGMARGQSLAELRLGLTVAIVVGGVISMAVLVVGTALGGGTLSFPELAEVLGRRLGSTGPLLLAGGLFAAGLSSAVTAPLAAAITARSLFADGDDDPRWSGTAGRFRAVWAVVLATGVLFGVIGVQPVPAIVLAQALNGLLLPLVAIFLALAVNDRRLMGDAVNGPLANALLAVVVAATVVLGLTNIAKAAARAFAVPLPSETTLFVGGLLVTAVLGVPLVRAALQRRAAA